MIKQYTTTVKAEVFDGSDDMVKKYGIESYENSGYGLPDFDYSLLTLEEYIGWNSDSCVWIVTGVNGEHWAIKDDIFKKTYVEAK